MVVDADRYSFPKGVVFFLVRGYDKPRLASFYFQGDLPPDKNLTFLGKDTLLPGGG